MISYDAVLGCYDNVTLNEEVVRMSETRVLEEIAALRKELNDRIDELQTVIRFALGGSPSSTQSSDTLSDGYVLKLMTSKQHAAMQMWLFAGMKGADMARRMGCSRNTARLHLKALWTKMGTEDKNDISRRLMPVFEKVSEEEYAEWSGGLPKNWAATYDEGRADPYLYLYVKNKADTYDRSKT
tara:strand:- start:439 stop:990 length:552 start_codon:yes stop_codon:yes gene_type:complete